MNEQSPKKPNLKIEHLREGYKGERKEEEGNAPMDVVKGLLSEEIIFEDEETQKKFEQLKKAHEEAQTDEEKAKIEFAIRQLILS